MKKIFAVVSLALMVAACTSTRGKLLSRIEYNGDGSVYKREVYHYSGDELALVTRVIYSNNVPDSSWTEYEIRHNGQITDTIETTNSIKRTIKSSDGSIRSYHLVGDEWKEEYYSKRDGKGRIIEYHSGDYHRWYSFDAQGRPAGDNYEFVNDNDQIQRGGNIIEYSDDGLKCERTSYYQIDTLPKVISGKRIEMYDNKGRIISSQPYDPDETDDNHPTLLSHTYQYTRRGETRIEYINNYYDGSYHKEPSIMYKIRYRHGLESKCVIYTMKDGKFTPQSVNKMKYDVRAGVPLKAIVYDPREPILFRRPSDITIWTYDK